MMKRIYFYSLATLAGLVVIWSGSFFSMLNDTMTAEGVFLLFSIILTPFNFAYLVKAIRDFVALGGKG